MSSLNRQETGETSQPIKNAQNTDIEYILNDIGGSYGKFQLFNYLLFAVPMCLSGIVSLTYVFTALNLDYRCYIPECEYKDQSEYTTDWLHDAIPFSQSKPLKCHRYQQISIYDDLYNDTSTELPTDITEVEFCSKDRFNRSIIEKCDEDGLIYRNKDITIVNEFGITCDDNEWKLAMVGAYNNIARLLFMPLSGILSDRFGRKTILVWGICTSCVAGFLQSFALSYSMFIIFEFLNAAVASVVYPATFILGMEWAGVKDRVAVSCIVTLMYPVGQALSGYFAFYARNFRIFLRLAFAPGIFAALLMYFAPESLRWLLVKGKRDRIHSLLSRAARTNNTQLSKITLDIVNDKCDAVLKSKRTSTSSDHDNTLRKLFTMKSLVVRFAICAFCWITGAYVNYGVSITSVSLNGDKYISFMVVAIGGVPSVLFTYFMLEYFGRPKCISLSLFITGASIVIAKILPSEYSTLALILFFIGKCFSLHSFTSIYIYTIELWPTPLRHSIMGLCSTIGRIGSILAPLTPLLAHFGELVPYLCFGLMSLIAGLLVLFLPETLNNDLPDTLEEAQNIRKKTS